MLGKHQIDSIKQLIVELVPCCVVTYSYGAQPSHSETQWFTETRTGEQAGLQITDHSASFWVENGKDQSEHAFRISRQEAPFTKKEKRVIRAIFDVCRANTIGNEKDVVFTQHSISSQFSMSHFVISYFMRGSNHACLWTSIIGLILLQKLSYKKYEGDMCTSGFVCLKTISGESVQKRIAEQGEYVFEPFEEPVPLNSAFFDKPLSYRYVDGRNSFYVIDNHETVLGVLRNVEPKDYDIIDRSTFAHIEKLKSIPGFRWLAYSGFHNDVYVHTRKGPVFQWDQGVWKNRELTTIEQLITNFGANPAFSKTLVRVLYTLSELRSGTLIFITKDQALPSVIGKIDETALGKALCSTMNGLTLDELRQSNGVIGLLTSDGMITFDTSGVLMDCGAIIDLSKGEKGATIVGGGRSQAACAASQYGLAIKVSEDGPISVYENTEKRFELH